MIDEIKKVYTGDWDTLAINNEQLRNIMFKDNALEHNILIYLNNVQVNDLHIKLQDNDNILLMTPIAGG